MSSFYARLAHLAPVRRMAQWGLIGACTSLVACAELATSTPSEPGDAAPAATPVAEESTAASAVPSQTMASGLGIEANAPAAWRAVRLPGKRPTQYRFGYKAGRAAWEASSEQSASMWRQAVQIPPQQLGEVAFSWWASDVLPGADMAAPGQGDSPTRVIFAFDGDHDRLSLRNRMLFDLASTLSGERPPFATLMYVWAGEGATPGAVITNPRTDRIRKIVLESGTAHLQQWRDYRRNLVEDFRRAFGEDPGPLIGIALMTDTDNTHTRTRSWYGAVRLLPTASRASTVVGQGSAAPAQTASATR